MEWNFIRRSLGKPRRCSPAFLAEERAALEHKRERIRLIQSRQWFPDTATEYVPEIIPIPLSLGLKVTAKLCQPVSGLFQGVIQAVDTANKSFRIRFDRPDIGTLTVDDFCVAVSYFHKFT
jgi:hypothetical protein